RQGRALPSAAPPPAASGLAGHLEPLPVAGRPERRSAEREQLAAPPGPAASAGRQAARETREAGERPGGLARAHQRPGPRQGYEVPLRTRQPRREGDARQGDER